MGAPGSIYNLLNGGHRSLLFSGAASTLCQLTNTVATPVTQGAGAMLPPSDPEYDASDELRGIPSFTGASYDPETGLMISADQAEIAIDQTPLTIGRPIQGWSGTLRNTDGNDLNFRVQDVMQDRTIGSFRLRLEILKATGTGRRINRAGESGV